MCCECVCVLECVDVCVCMHVHVYACACERMCCVYACACLPMTYLITIVAIMQLVDIFTDARQPWLHIVFHYRVQNNSQPLAIFQPISLFDQSV